MTGQRLQTLFILTGLLLTSVLTCKGQLELVEDKRSILLTDFQNNEYDTCSNITCLDAHLYKLLKKNGLFLASKGQDYNATCMVDKKQPNSQIMLYGYSKDIHFLIYSRGGFGVSRHCMILRRISKKNYEFIRVDIKFKVKTLDGLREALKNSADKQ